MPNLLGIILAIVIQALGPASTLAAGQGPAASNGTESCYSGINVVPPAVQPVKIVLVDNSTAFGAEFREATVRATKNWPRHGDRLVVLRFASAPGAEMPEVVLDRAIAPNLANRGWLSHAKDQQIDRCLERQLRELRQQFSSSVAKALESYHPDRDGRSQIAASLVQLESLVASVPKGQAQILLLSDGIENSGQPPHGVSFYQTGARQQLRLIAPEAELASLKTIGAVPSLSGVSIWMAGLGLPEPGPDHAPPIRRTARELLLLKTFWTRFLSESGAQIMEITSTSPLRALQ